jgi:hypothetical protein
VEGSPKFYFFTLDGSAWHNAMRKPSIYWAFRIFEYMCYLYIFGCTLVKACLAGLFEHDNYYNILTVIMQLTQDIEALIGLIEGTYHDPDDWIAGCALCRSAVLGASTCARPRSTEPVTTPG